MTAADGAPLSLTCPQCLKRLQAPAALAGKQSHCPFCHRMIDVPLQSQPRKKGDEYPLQSQSGPSAAEKEACILVICGVCHARMHPPESELGRQVICPDCGTPAVVCRPPEEPAKKPRPTSEEIGEYALATDAGRAPGAVPAAEQDYVPVVCSLCHTRMLATADQVGSRLICPDCGTPAVVPPMPPPRKKIDVMADADEEYAIIGAADILPQAPLPVPRPSEPSPSAKPIEERVRRRPVLPDRPFLDGTFTFPFSKCMWGHTLMLCGWAILPCIAVWKSVHINGEDSTTAMFTIATLLASATIIGMFWYVVASANVLTVLRETSEGCDMIENWPGAVFLDWAGESLLLFFGLCMSVVPGVVLTSLLVSLGFPAGVSSLLMPLSLFLTFPIVFLSILETNSMFGLVSWPVLRTLAAAKAGWAGFYTASAMLWGAAILVNAVFYWLSGFVGSLVGGVVQTLSWIIYFRLIGRLAWYCADHAAREDADDESDDEFEEEVLYEDDLS
jgi:hypothetical protein